MRRSLRALQLLAVAVSTLTGACAGCGPETTSFRALDKGDDAELPGAAYDVRMGESPIATVHVWSNGGYVSISKQPMTHVGFEIRNTSPQPIAFDTDALELTTFDNTATQLPRAEITSIEPSGPTLRPVRPGAAILIGAYFAIPVRPRAVEAMQIGWALRTGDLRYVQFTRFTRDDDYPVVDAPHTADVIRMRD
ncbi:MAG TPA: hypothetical protein VFK02_35895 [Kofleriaceae bacterium]|nr:hypothetical protein [Kofleriaceae bacterium]